MLRRTRDQGSLSSFVHAGNSAVCGWCDCSRKHQDNPHAEQLSVLPPPRISKKFMASSSLLTGHQRLNVQKTWHLLSTDITSLAISTMLRLLQRNSGFAQLFHLNLSASVELQTNPKLRQHAFWLIQAVSAIVENLDDLDLVVSDMLFEIGEKHAYIPNFSSKFFSTLPNAWNGVWEDTLKERFTAQTKKSWSRIFQYIVAQLMDGCMDRTILGRVKGPTEKTNLLENPIDKSLLMASDMPSPHDSFHGDNDESLSDSVKSIKSFSSLKELPLDSDKNMNPYCLWKAKVGAVDKVDDKLSLASGYVVARESNLFNEVGLSDSLVQWVKSLSSEPELRRPSDQSVDCRSSRSLLFNLCKVLKKTNQEDDYEGGNVDEGGSAFEGQGVRGRFAQTESLMRVISPFSNTEEGSPQTNVPMRKPEDVNFIRTEESVGTPPLSIIQDN